MRRFLLEQRQDKLGRNFVMVDQNPESIEVMTARYAKAGLGNVRFVELTD